MSQIGPQNVTHTKLFEDSLGPSLIVFGRLILKEACKFTDVTFLKAFSVLQAAAFKHQAFSPSQIGGAPSKVTGDGKTEKVHAALMPAPMKFSLHLT